LAKSCNFRPLTHKNIKIIQYFIFFLNTVLAKGWASAPLASPPWWALACNRKNYIWSVENNTEGECCEGNSDMGPFLEMDPI